MNPDLDLLRPYPFQRLSALYADIDPTLAADKRPIAWSMGEPRHPTPKLIRDALTQALDGLGSYPATRGEPALRAAIARWLQRRFRAEADPETQILSVNGTREALFAIAQAVIDRSRDPLVLMPNPFYQIYEGAALLAGAKPVYLACTEENGFLPDLEAVPAAVWERCQLLYLCTPGNPSGATAPAHYLRRALDLADTHDFLIVSDECYSELYHPDDAPPVGLLEVRATTGRSDFSRCLVAHSLSKRSNAPGLRSGFIAGDAAVLERFLLYRTYHGCAMPPATQAASIAAWEDEEHVHDNRRLYREKFDAVVEILIPVLEVRRPQAGFYLWPNTPISDTRFARALRERENVAVLPGRYLSREQATEDGDTLDPGRNRIRIALVATLDECIEGARRVRRFIENDGVRLPSSK